MTAWPQSPFFKASCCPCSTLNWELASKGGGQRGFKTYSPYELSGGMPTTTMIFVTHDIGEAIIRGPRRLAASARPTLASPGPYGLTMVALRV